MFHARRSGYRSGMRSALLMLACIAASALFAGCGGSSSSSGTGMQAKASQSSSAAQMFKAQAVAYARSVNLTASDVPGAMVRSVERESGPPSREEVKFSSCAGGVSPERRVVNVKSASLQIGQGIQGTRVKSSVEVFPTAGLETRNFAAARSSRGRACLMRLLPQVLGGTTESATGFGPGKVTFLPPVHGSFGVRISTSASAAGKQVPVYLDIFEFVAGPAEVGLSFVSISHPVSLATEHRLLSLLMKRADTNQLLDRE
jgi:outer membrane murein-binding lipoprotein Lpp